MDDIYGDLDNYNDVNAIDELRNENKGLKLKIEEYATNMDKLQKDFDKLASEFKKLEINYSSLLKTAKAEIERKTQIITNLNMEKDMMVLGSIHNSNKSISALRTNIARNRSNSCRSRRDIDPDLAKGYKKEPPLVKNPERQRIEENRLPSIETASSVYTDDTNNLVNIDKLNKNKIESYDKGSESKENLIKNKRPESLKNRRKSVLSKQFSSDEDNGSGEDINPRESPPRNLKSRKSYQNDRQKQIHKISETSGIDEKYSGYYESSRKRYYKGKPKYSDKYRKSQRHKRLYSPERGRRGSKEYPEELYQRSEFKRHRVLESPPFEKYDSQHRFRNRRSINNREETITEERMKSHQERLSVKQRASSDYEMPSSKRPRTESNVIPADEDVKENENHQKPDTQRQAQERKLSGCLDHLLITSCQSPDYDTVSIPSHPVKEIMPTASVQLDDPRLTSKKYVKKIVADKVILSTATGRNIGLKHIQSSMWNIPKVALPVALQKPLPVTENKMQEFYGDRDSETNDGATVDYVTKNFLQDYENERNNLKSFGKDKINILEGLNFSNVIAENHRTSHTEEHNASRVEKDEPAVLPNPLGILLAQLHSTCGIDKSVKPKENKLDVDDIFSTGEEKVQSCKVTISKDDLNLSSLLKSTPKQSARELVEGDLALSDETTDNTEIRKHSKKDKISTTEVKNQLSRSKSTQKHDEIYKSGDNHKISQRSSLSKDKETEVKNQPSRRKSTQKHDEIDKTGDNKISQRSSLSKEEETEINKSEDNNKISQRSSLSKDEETLKSDKKSKSQTKHVQKEDKALDTEGKSITSHCKPKKQKTDNKISSNDLEVVKASEKIANNPSLDGKKNTNVRKKIEKKKKTSKEAENVPENKTKKFKEIKTKIKFSDLFGDSSSLITPEDLGLENALGQSEPVKQYVPIFEDAQDANDVNVKTLKELNTQLPNLLAGGEDMAKPNPSTEKMPKNTSDLSVNVLPNLLAGGEDMAKPSPSTEKMPKNTSELSVNVDTKEYDNDGVCISVQDGNLNLEVVNAEADKEPDVIKTVVISTGVQPSLENIQPHLNTNEECIFDNTPKANAVKSLKNVPMVGLATSTPYKHNIILETEIDSSCTSSEVLAKDASSIGKTAVSSGLDPQMDADMPDVRIFVRRRKRNK